MKTGLFASALTAALLSTFFCAAANAADLYVSPKGTPEGDGSPGNPLDIVTALGAKSPAKPGDTVLIGDGVYDGPMKDITRDPFIWALSGTAEKPIIVKPAKDAKPLLNGIADLSGSNVWFMNLEVGDLDWDPSQEKHKEANSAFTASAGDNCKIINCNFFGGAMGTGLWSNCTNLEVYGCLVHDFGFHISGRGQGHAFYCQNEKGTKTISNNIAYRGCGWNLHLYTKMGKINGFDILDNIFFMAGAAVPNQTMDNFLVAGHAPADNIRLIGNVGYQPSMVNEMRPNARMAYYHDVVDLTGEVKDNYFAGACFGLSIGEWKSLTVTGNTIWASKVLIEVNSNPTGSGNIPRDHKPDPSAFKIDNNKYILPESANAFRYANHEVVLPGELIDFDAWKKIGFDAHSTIEPGKNGKPTGTKVFVFPNKYEPGRATVGVFNWDGKDHADVDLSKVLKRGQSCTIYNCLDVKQTLAKTVPVASVKYAGDAVSLPLRRDPASPDFDAFLIVPR